MSVFSVLKKIGNVIGKVGKFAAPALNFIPGVGPLAAAGIGAGAGLLENVTGDKPSVGGALKSGLTGGALGLAGGAAKGLLNSGSLQKYGKLGDFLSGVGDRFRQPGGGVDFGKLAELGLVGGSALAGAKKSSQGNALMDSVNTDLASRSADQAAIRKALVARLAGAPQAAPDLTGTFATGNPYARYAKIGRAA